MDNASSSNWLALLRRKIHKKFKRNRQKVQNNSEIVETTQESNPQQEECNAIEQLNNINKNSDDMKKELYKLNCYWPNLR